MTTIITITTSEIGTISNNCYDYSGGDRILKNIITDEYEVLYSGQIQGRLDYQLEGAVMNKHNFRVYYRENPNSPFIFLGYTPHSSIIHERTVAKGNNSQPNERLQIRLVIPSINISNTQIESLFEGSGKYKKAILHHSNFDLVGRNMVVGFYTKK